MPVTYMKLHKTHLLTGIATLMLILNISLLLWYEFYGYQTIFHSDSAVKVLLAREIYDSGNFFPKDWNYANGDLFVVFGHIFVLPLLKFLPAGFYTHAISGTIFAGWILFTIWLIARLEDLPLWQKISILAVAASGISGFMAENLYGQVSYGVVLLFSCNIIYLSAKYITSKAEHRVVWTILLFFTMVFAYWANPKRAVVSYGLPLTAALIWILKDSSDQERRTLFKLFGLTILGALVGSALHTYVLSGVINVLRAANATWLPIDLIPRNIGYAIKGIFAQLGGLPPAGVSIYSLMGLYGMLRFALVFLIAYQVPFAIGRAISSKSTVVKVLALYATCSIALTFLLQTTTTIPDVGDPIQSSRYLVPGVILCLLTLLMAPPPNISMPMQKVSLTVIFLALSTGSFSNFLLSDLSSGNALAQPGQIDPSREQLLKALNQDGLHYGYSSYWNAGVLSVMSNESVRVRQVQISEGLPSPMRHLSANHWYEPKAWRGPSFLLLTKLEAPAIDWDKMKKLGLSPEKEFRSGNFYIYVFSKNIAESLPGWDTSYKNAALFLPSESTLRRTGQLEKENGNTILTAHKGQRGVLHHGSRVDIEPGKYRATFDVMANYHPDGTARLDVVSISRRVVLSEMPVLESQSAQFIDFTINTRETIELRVWALGNETVRLKSMSLVRRND